MDDSKGSNKDKDKLINEEEQERLLCSYSQVNLINDNPRVHSNLVKEIEELLKNLMIDYNESIIIQMSFQEKIDIRLKLQGIKKARDIAKDKHEKYECLSDSNLHLNPRELEKLMQKRSFQKKKLQINFNKNSKGSSSKNSRYRAMQMEYDFYFKNNQGLFVF